MIQASMMADHYAKHESINTLIHVQYTYHYKYGTCTVQAATGLPPGLRQPAS